MSRRGFPHSLGLAQHKSVETLAVFKNSQSGALTQNLEQDSLGWKKADLPRSFRDLSLFHRLILLRVFRPDRLSSALNNFVEANLGAEVVERQPFDMEKTYKKTSPMSPMFFGDKDYESEENRRVEIQYH
jgi:dynein heavy chain